MLTPQDVKDRSFTKALFGGYDMGTVDEFIDTLAEDYEALYKENAILKGKLKVLIEKVEEFRSTEDAMRMALSTAKKMADDMVEEAKKKTESMLKEKEAEAALKMAEIRSLIAGEEKRLKAAQQVTADFVDMSIGLCRQHVTFLQKLGELDVSDPAAKAEVPPQKTEKSSDAAKEIEESVAKIFEKPDSGAKMEAAAGIAPTKLPEGWDDDNESEGQRSKLEFRELKFGNNYTEKED